MTTRACHSAATTCASTWASTAALVGTLLMAGCSCASQPAPQRVGPASPAGPAIESHRSPSRPREPVRVRPLDPSELSPAEAKFGRAPGRDPSVTYQPEVILVDGGPDVIRSLSPDGLTWTIDARAGHADQVGVGTIAYVTGLCVGRVLHVERKDGALAMMLGPVQLTEVFKDLDLVSEGTIDLARASRYAGPVFADRPYPVEGDDAAPPDWSVGLPPFASRTGARRSAPAWFVRHAAFQQQPPPGSAGLLPIAPALSWKTAPLSNADGIGVEMRHDGKNGLRVVAQVQLRVAKPEFKFHLAIHDSGVAAELILKNAAGLHLAFDAAGNEAFNGTVKWFAPAPLVIRVPLSGPGGFQLDIRQGIWVATSFASKQSAFSAAGDYEFNADLGFTYWNGTFTTIGPGGLTVKRSVMSDMTNVALGPTGIVISHEATAMGKIGFADFGAGPYVSLLTSAGIAEGSSVGIVQCRGTTLAMKVAGGVGWTIPKPVATIVNFFLSLVRAKPIADHGSVVKTPYKTLFERQSVTQSPVCGESGAAGS